jgi:hypothetical protein
MVDQYIYSPPLYTSITQTIGIENIEPDAYEEDDAYNQANVIVINDGNPQSHTFHDVGDADWAKFYGVSGQTYKIKASNLSIVCDAVIEVYDSDGATLLSGPKNDAGAGLEEYIDWTCPKDGVYYVKISNFNSNFGENVKYDLSVYRPIGAGAGTILGRVADSSDKGIEGAILKSSVNTTAITLPNGFYRMQAPSGVNFTVTVTANEYETASQTGISVTNEGTTTLNFVMSRVDIQKGDLNNDRTVDLMDAVLAAQIITGIKPSETLYKQADIDGDERIGIEELIYILQKISGVS